ncbi:uncharacterized protein LOC143240093 [Tachypleus tridentatus]|uniref:uncharacterized protein LOC143240093 n=1 Tax=Tachypleus tridentatus TaxID=6853 RepID=UPI003FD13CB9
MDEATDISCYIFGPVDRNNELWKSFSRQSRVTTFMLTSRPSDPLQFVPMETLARIPLVEEIYIKESSLGILEKNSFAYKDHLRTIILERNEITGLRKYTFSNLSVLTKLSLSENYIQELKKMAFYHLQRLTFLFLDRNNITWIEDDAFVHLPNLSELELWDNNIRQLTPKSLAGLKSLRRLDLYKNHITILGDRIFHGTPRLQELDLKHNYISQITPHAFDGLPLLSTLYLNHNLLKELPDHVFLGAPNLRYLELSDNHLRIIQASIIGDLKNALTEHFVLYFKGNKLQCDCRLTWIKRYAETAKNHLFQQELQNIKCQFQGIISMKNDLITVTNLTEEILKCPKHITTSTTTTPSTTITEQPSKLKETTQKQSSFLNDDPKESKQSKLAYQKTPHKDHAPEIEIKTSSKSKSHVAPNDEDGNLASAVLPQLMLQINTVLLICLLWLY